MFKSLFRLAPALAAGICISASIAPAFADDQDGEAPATAEPAADDAASEAATPFDEGAALDGLPANDLGAAASKVSSPILKPADSLHTTPKVLNNSALTNDFKNALKNAAPAPAPTEPAANLTTLAPPAPPASAATADVAPEIIQLEIAPATDKSAVAASAAPAAAEKPPAPARPLAPILALVALGVAALGGGLAFRFVRRAKTP